MGSTIGDRDRIGQDDTARIAAATVEDIVRAINSLGINANRLTATTTGSITQASTMTTPQITANITRGNMDQPEWPTTASAIQASIRARMVQHSRQPTAGEQASRPPRYQSASSTRRSEGHHLRKHQAACATNHGYLSNIPDSNITNYSAANDSNLWRLTNCSYHR